MANDVLIVGGGLAGLCCARLLHRSGMSFQLFEASDAVGGRIRTDLVDGFRLDRGFQVFLESYPEAQKVLDYHALQLKQFQPGALVRFDGRFHEMADPWRQPCSIFSSAMNPIGSLVDKLRIAKLRAQVLKGSLDDQISKTNNTTLEYLQQQGFSDSMIDRFWRPFFGGIFLETDLATSSRMFRFVFRMMALGPACLPSSGMQAIPQQLASQLPEASLRFNSPVDMVQPGEIRLASGESIGGRAVVVACDGPQASKLLIGLPSVNTRRVSCLYFAANKPPHTRPILVLNGERDGPINNLCVPTAVASSYGTATQSLISVSVLEDFDTPASMLAAVLKQLRRWYGDPVDTWTHLRTYIIDNALPSQPPAVLEHPSRDVRYKPGIYVGGDHRENASINGAMVSGRLAAEAVLADLK